MPHVPHLCRNRPRTTPSNERLWKSSPQKHFLYTSRSHIRFVRSFFSSTRHRRWTNVAGRRPLSREKPLEIENETNPSQKEHEQNNATCHCTQRKYRSSFHQMGWVGEESERKTTTFSASWSLRSSSWNWKLYINLRQRYTARPGVSYDCRRCLCHSPIREKHG